MPKPRDYAITGRKEVPHGKGTRWCKRCGAFDGLIQQYDMLLCRQCFRDIASGLGFAKYN